MAGTCPIYRNGSDLKDQKPTHIYGGNFKCTDGSQMGDNLNQKLSEETMCKENYYTLKIQG